MISKCLLNRSRSLLNPLRRIHYDVPPSFSLLHTHAFVSLAKEEGGEEKREHLSVGNELFATNLQRLQHPASLSVSYHHTTFQRRNFSTTSIISFVRPNLTTAPVVTLAAHRAYHTSAPKERGAVAVILGFASLSAASYAGASAVRAYREWKANQPSPEELEEMAKQEEAARKEEEAEAAKQQKQQQQTTNDSGKDEKRENIFASWFGMDVGTNYYEGGFEETMTRREAALILGVRESSSTSRIKEAHRKLLVLNHPDTGGSTYIAGKINEAKELLLKNKQKE